MESFGSYEICFDHRWRSDIEDFLSVVGQRNVVDSRAREILPSHFWIFCINIYRSEIVMIVSL